MIKQSLDEKLAQQATFIFKGTVEKLKAATIESVPLTAKTIVVRVDEILRAPELLTQYGGTKITVQLGSREQVKKGEQAIFYTNSWLVGDSLAVQSVGHTAVEAGSQATPRKARAAAAAAASDQAEPGLTAQVADADTVVTGRVTSVRVLEEPAAKASADSASTEQFQPISEHSPVWHEAVIEVADVEKGRNIPKEIVVRFPSSTDVKWYDAPKFRPGQEGVFLLRKESKKETGKLASAVAQPTRGKAAEKIYTALDATAIQPLQKVETIRTLIKGAK
jgi:hypothetical protein